VAIPAPATVKTVVPIANVIRYGNQCPGQSGKVEHTHQLAAEYPAKMIAPSAAPMLVPIINAFFIAS